MDCQNKMKLTATQMQKNAKRQKRKRCQKKKRRTASLRCQKNDQACICIPAPPLSRAQGGGGPVDAVEGKGPQRWPQRRLGRRLEEVAEAVGGGYCRLQMPLTLVLGVRGTVAGHRLGALEKGGFQCIPGSSPPHPLWCCIFRASKAPKKIFDCLKLGRIFSGVCMCGGGGGGSRGVGGWCGIPPPRQQTPRIHPPQWC